MVVDIGCDMVEYLSFYACFPCLLNLFLPFSALPWLKEFIRAVCQSCNYLRVAFIRAHSTALKLSRVFHQPLFHLRYRLVQIVRLHHEPFSTNYWSQKAWNWKWYDVLRHDSLNFLRLFAVSDGLLSMSFMRFASVCLHLSQVHQSLHSSMVAQNGCPQIGRNCAHWLGCKLCLILLCSWCRKESWCLLSKPISQRSRAEQKNCLVGLWVLFIENFYRKVCIRAFAD